MREISSPKETNSTQHDISWLWATGGSETRREEHIVDQALTTEKTFGGETLRGEIRCILCEKNKGLISDESGKDREQAHQDDAANPAGTIRHDRQSVVWLVEPAWKAIVTLL